MSKHSDTGTWSHTVARSTVRGSGNCPVVRTSNAAPRRVFVDTTKHTQTIQAVHAQSDGIYTYTQGALRCFVFDDS